MADGSEIAGVVTSAACCRADSYVMALGSCVARSLGISAPLSDQGLLDHRAASEAAPVSTVMDESYKVAITRLGTRVRDGGTAEVSYDTLHPARRATLDQSLTDLFPGGGDISKRPAGVDCGQSVSNSPPIIGATGYRNPHLNTSRYARLDDGVRLRHACRRRTSSIASPTSMG